MIHVSNVCAPFLLLGLPVNLVYLIMKEIVLTKGQVALVDDSDYEWLNQWKWCAKKDKYTYYAYRKDYSLGKHNSVAIIMHRLILQLNDPKIEVDHEDGNGLNNQRSNLRVATRTENIYNRKIFKNNQSGLKGVSLHRGRWRATIQKDKKAIHIGYFICKEDAAIAYNNKAIELHGDFARINNISKFAPIGSY